MTTKRLYIALAWFALLACGASLTLYGTARLVVWIFLGGLAAKSWIAWMKQRRGDS